jgi:P-type Cu+ transporter
MTSNTSLQPAPTRISLDVTGMTCASCAARIEKKLNRLDGVQAATVNFATGTARVDLVDTGLGVDTLIETVRAAGYDAAPPPPEPTDDDDSGSLLLRLVITAELSFPVVLIGMIPFLQIPGWEWLSLMLAVPAVIGGGYPFHRAMIVNARHGASTMDTLVSVGTLAALGWSIWAVLTGGGHLYFEAATAVTTFLLAGRYLEARAKRRAGAALRALLRLGAREASVLPDGPGTTRETRVPAEDLRVDDVFVVRPGEAVAADGMVLAGRSAVDRSMLTGESVPEDVAPGDEVIGGTVNTTGRLEVRATRVGADTQLARTAALVQQAQDGKAQVQRLADRVSGVFVPVVIAVAVVTFASWWVIGGDLTAAFTAGIAVLIIACPCALGLATPTALLVGTGRGAGLGIVIRGPEVLESTRTVDTVLLDKTGTLTTGVMAVQQVLPADGENADEVLAVAAAAERGSEHPIGRAIAAATDSALSVEDFVADPGSGVRARVAGHGEVVVGRAGDPDQQGTVVEVSWGGRRRGQIRVADEVKPTAAQAVTQLKALGLHPVLLTGDSRGAAEGVARQYGIDDVVAQVTPQGKIDEVRRRQADGAVVAMVGDGVNDAAALAAAELGIAMGTGTDAAIEAADLTLVRGEPQLIPDAVRLSRRTLRIIKGNLFWAFAYNVAGIPLAAAGLLSPMIAGAAMAFSSVFVVLNSLRLARFR